MGILPADGYGVELDRLAWRPATSSMARIVVLVRIPLIARRSCASAARAVLQLRAGRIGAPRGGARLSPLPYSPGIPKGASVSAARTLGDQSWWCAPFCH